MIEDIIYFFPGFALFVCAEGDEAPPLLAGVAERPADALALVAAQQPTIAFLLETA